jgi:uncharacterized protein
MIEVAHMIFPRTIAEGRAFCNRDLERERLKYNIESIQHTLVISPRRYGKTSLILKSIDELAWPFIHLDLFLAFEEQKIVDRFLDAIAKLIANIMPLNTKTLGKLRDFFSLFTFSLSSGEVELSLSLKSSESNHAKTLRNAIEGLERFLIKHKKKAVFFIDEMQDIVNNPICGEIEAILRFYAQKTKQLSFIFSGSNRKLLKEIFDDSKRPLFKLCDRINLKRINRNSHEKFIQKASLRKWKKELSSETINLILDKTEDHSFYINYLCSNLWRSKTLPNIKLVKQEWRTICENESSAIATDIALLSGGQKLILAHIAEKDFTKNTTSKDFLHQVQMTLRGAQQSIKGLLNKDLIEEAPEGYRVIDPILKNLLLS